jgi:hypothetical protein
MVLARRRKPFRFTLPPDSNNLVVEPYCHAFARSDKLLQLEERVNAFRLTERLTESVAVFPFPLPTLPSIAAGEPCVFFAILEELHSLLTEKQHGLSHLLPSKLNFTALLLRL